MTRRIVIAFGVVVSIAAIVFGPDLLEYMRFERSLSDAAKADEMNGGRWPQRTDACTPCHGLNGNAVNQVYADLAGQPATYIDAQLHAFANGERTSPFMGPLALSLTDKDLQGLSTYFARQGANNNDGFAPDRTLSARGKDLSSACAACHDSEFMGRDLNPRLAGQGYDYLLAQMTAFANQTRRDPTGAMNAIASSMSDLDRRAVATYLASYPVTHNEQQHP